MGGRGTTENAVVIGALQTGAVVAFGALENGAYGDSEIRKIRNEASSIGAVARLFFLYANAESEASVEKVFDAASQILTVLETVIICLPAPQRAEAPLAELDLASWNAILWRQLRRPFLLGRRAIEEFLAQGEGGRLIFLWPGLERDSDAGAASQAAQTALRAFTRSVAKEYGRRGITCNMVIANQDAQATAQIALFLASDGATFVSGEILGVHP